jgi:hypothetical protein
LSTFAFMFLFIDGGSGGREPFREEGAEDDENEMRVRTSSMPRKERLPFMRSDFLWHPSFLNRQLLSLFFFVYYCILFFLVDFKSPKKKSTLDDDRMTDER